MKPPKANRRLPLIWWVLGAIVVGLVVVVLLPHPSHIVRITKDDPELVAAIKSARSELPTFFNEVKKAPPGERFAVKVRFKTPYGPEYLWCKNPVVNGDQVEATVDQPPIAVPGIKRGDTAKFASAEIVDWLIKSGDGSLRGGLTEKVLAR